MHRFIIAGIDPGATVGIALLDLSGKKIATFSSSGGGISEAVKFIEQHGTPSIIACDVNPAPEMALRLASYFSCRIYSPAKEIREEEKRKAAAGADVRNNHERDAYTAALYAYRQNANNLRQIDALEGLAAQDREKIKHLLLKGYKIRDAFLELSEPVEETRLPKQAPSVQPAQLNPEELRARVSALARENAHLRMLVARLEAEKRQLADRMHLLENGVRQNFLRDTELRKLRFQLGQTLQKLSSKQAWKKGAQQKGEPLDGQLQEKQAADPEKNQQAQKIRQSQFDPNAPPQERQRQDSATAPQRNPQKQNTDIPSSQQQPGGNASRKEAVLNNLRNSGLDLEKMVAEYRRGKK